MSESNPTYVVLKNVRLSYARIWKPEAGIDGGEPKYSTSIIIGKDQKENLKKIEAAIKAATEQGKSGKWNGKIPSNLKKPLRDGDEDRADLEEYNNAFFVNASSKRKPGIVDGGRNPITDETMVYSGCYVNVSLNFYPYDTKGSKGVAAGLNNIQLVKQGESLGGSFAKPEDDFEEIESDDLGL